MKEITIITYFLKNPTANHNIEISIFLWDLSTLN